MFANVKIEREKERERLVQARQSKHCIGGSTRKEREIDMCVCSFEFRQFVFFTMGTCLRRLFQSFVSIFAKKKKKKKKKKSDRTRCQAVSIPGYNLGPKFTGSEQ